MLWLREGKTFLAAFAHLNICGKKDNGLALFKLYFFCKLEMLLELIYQIHLFYLFQVMSSASARSVLLQV